MNNEKSRVSENMQDEKLSTIILSRIAKASLVPTIGIAIIVSAILYFANSREFYFVQSEDQIRDSKYKIIPPSDHLIRTGEGYQIHVMAKRPLKGLSSTKIPIAICLIHIWIVVAYKKEGEPAV